MSRPGEAEAVEAVLQTAWRDSPFEFDKHANHILDGGCAVCHKDVPAIIAAAYSVIERAVREKIAAEIEREAEREKDALPPRWPGDAFWEGVCSGKVRAAVIARGGA